MVRIEEYQEGLVHTVQEGGSSSPSSIASNGSVPFELQHRETEQERLAREAHNIDRFNRRQAEAEAEVEARRIRL